MQEVLNERWEIQEALGRGATGTVFKGKDLKEGTTVAIKRVERKHLSKKQFADLMSELELLQQFRHTNIVRIIDHSVTKRELCFILEYMDNGSLTHMLRKFGQFPENVVATYIQQILQGLNYLHSHNVVHRDIKGDNILISGDNRVCLADFGLARKIDPESTPMAEDDDLDHQVEGTTYWLAPEVILMSGQTVVSDIWSLGSTIIELLTGNPPYSQYSAMGAIFHIVKDDHPPLPKGISSNLEDFLTHCFDKDVSSRPHASRLLNHPWIPQASKPINALELRNSLKDYNRQPTVLAAPVVSEIEIEQNVECNPTSNDTVEREVQILQNLSESDMKKLRIMEVLEKMTAKLDGLEKRISKRRAADENLAKLSHIYGKWLKDYKYNCEKQHKIIKEQLVHDLLAKDSLKKELMNLKRSAFPVATVVDDIVTSDSTQLRAGDIVFIFADCNALSHCGLSLDATNHSASCCCVVECKDTSHITTISRNKIQLMAPKESDSTETKLPALDSRLTLDVESAEKLLRSIQHQNKKDKLGGFFGASSSEIDQGLKQSNTKIPLSPSSARASSILRKSYDIMKGLHLARASYVSIPVQTNAVASCDTEDRENTFLFLLEIQDHQDLFKGATLVRYGNLAVAVGSPEDETGADCSEQLKQRHLFLFDNNNLIIAKKKLRWPNDENYFRIKQAVPLSEGKLIYISTLDNLKEKVGQARFQIIHKDMGFTFCIDNPVVSTSAELHSWFQCLKDRVKQLQKERMSRLTISNYPTAQKEPL